MCRRCGDHRPAPDRAWRCDCGGLFDLVGLVGSGVDPIAATDGVWSMWRYRRALPGGDGDVWREVTLGEGMTPLVPAAPGWWWKLDQLAPTGSFKDRGTAVLAAAARILGAERVVEDSSGNAGLSVAAYAARAGLAAEIFVPDSTDPALLGSIRSHGATVVAVPGGREAAAAAARERADDPGVWFASHVFQPGFVHGVKTVAFELWEQLGGTSPATVVVPAGNGTVVMGLWLGFNELARAGRGRPPVLVAAQAEVCAPLAGGAAPLADGAGGGVGSVPTAARGIAVARPARRGEVRAALMASGGRVLTATEAEIAAAGEDLARRGILVEPTSATAWAVARRLGGARAPVVVVLTGRNR